MRVVTTERELGEYRGGVLVPTMGALHRGHLDLVKQAAESAAGRSPVVVSVFVNPAQFNDPGDLEKYPRDLDADVSACAAVGADVVLAPGVDEVYPDGLDAGEIELPAVATEPGLEDRYRPGHFAGVCRVVKRLFELASPASAVFGEKDWQQLQVVRAMTAMHGLGVEIVAAPTVREGDGLAMSSRNRHLSGFERVRACALNRALRMACGETDPEKAESAMRRVLDESGIDAEYAVVREAEGLARHPEKREAARALVAAPVGGTRLLDNVGWGEA